MGQKVTMNESQLREKVYNMVCESLEAVINEGKTFKDQKSWNKKGFQKSNKFQKNDKYQNWKNGGNVNSDQDECMNEGFGDRVRGAVQGFRQGKQNLDWNETDARGNGNRYNTLKSAINDALVALNGNDVQLAKSKLTGALNLAQQNDVMNTPGTMSPYGGIALEEGDFMNSDQDECMNEGKGKEELGYSVIEKGNGDYPKKVKLNGKDGLDKLYKSKQFIQKNK